MLSRREFIRQAACASLELTSVVNSLAFLRLTSAAMAQGQEPLDYKALVCIFLAGGNDSGNLLIPLGSAADNPLRADYEAGRGSLALPVAGLHALNMPAETNLFKKYYGSGSSPLGLHPNGPEIATLFDAGDLAFVCNIGSLLYPFGSRDDYISGRVPAPPDLFSHNSQQMQWQTSIPDKAGQTGWGGRIADMLYEAYSAEDAKVSMSISLDGINTFQRGVRGETAAFTVGQKGTRPLKGFSNDPANPTLDPYGEAYFPGGSFLAPNYQDNRQGNRLRTVERLLNLTSENLMEQEYAQRVITARTAEDIIGNALTTADGSGVDYETHFLNAGTRLGDQLKLVAKMITGRSVLGNRRQIFFVRALGYDIHTDHLNAHAKLIDELSTGLLAFRDALVAAGDWDKVVAFTASDFSRTFTPNGTDLTTGTDHAWASHQMVMGGAVNGGQLYGHFPSLKVGDHPESIDAESFGRGRFIPSVSVDQYSAVMARWFGVDSNSMEAIFPNLGRFNDPFSSADANLGFL